MSISMAEKTYFRKIIDNILKNIENSN